MGKMKVCNANYGATRWRGLKWGMVLDCHIGMKTLPIKTWEHVWITRECEHCTWCLSHYCFVSLVPLSFSFSLCSMNPGVKNSRMPATFCFGTNIWWNQYHYRTSRSSVSRARTQDKQYRYEYRRRGWRYRYQCARPPSRGASSAGRGWSSNGLGHHYQLEVCLEVTCDLVRNGATPPSPDIDYE